MHAPSHENAMTEIALALAMGFFSIMVLTLISFGAPDGDPATVDAVVVTPSTNGGPGQTAVETEDLIVVFHRGGFLTQSMTPLLPDAIQEHTGRIVLAVHPTAPLTDVLRARKKIKSENLIVTQLDHAWLDALANRGRAQP